MPITSSLNRLCNGIATGNSSQIALGASLLVLDIFTFGEASVSIKGVKGVTVIGEGMARVESIASKIPGAKTLKDMPVFIGTTYQRTSQMMQYNRTWLLKEMRSGSTILDIGLDATRTNPSIFYQMEQNMIKNYKLLHP